MSSYSRSWKRKTEKAAEVMVQIKAQVTEQIEATVTNSLPDKVTSSVAIPLPLRKKRVICHKISYHTQYVLYV